MTNQKDAYKISQNAEYEAAIERLLELGYTQENYGIIIRGCIKTKDGRVYYVWCSDTVPMREQFPGNEYDWN